MENIENIEKIKIRKIVPVAGKISTGKSKLLNILYNFNFLECKSGIATKFINLLRYNPYLEQPCFYHLVLKKEGEKYVFYKDLNEVYEGEEKIIKANKDINQKLYNIKNINYENYFYMTEVNCSLIKDSDYLLSHDLCDIPGLSEYQQNYQQIEINKKGKDKEVQIKEKTEEEIIENYIINLANDLGFYLNKKDNENEKEKIKEEEENVKLITKEKDNEKEDDIYYKLNNESNTYLTEIFTIIKKYIDGLIIILSIENYYFEENFELIVRLHKVIKRDITNCLILLNKMDLSKRPEEDIEKCKGTIINHFPKFHTFNLNLNIFVALSINKIQNELLMKKDFKHLIFYHCHNFIENINKINIEEAKNKTFINHLMDIIKTEDILQKNLNRN